MVKKESIMEKTCAKCNSKMKPVKIMSFGASIKIAEKASKLLDNKSSSIGFYACPKCGIVEIYADRPENFA